MLKIILIDDEKAALRMLERRLKDYPEAFVDGGFLNPIPALERIGAIRPDVVFLDINMPQLRGLEAAEKIRSISPNTHIVFVTVYDSYAVDAFEVDAVDYLLKPVSKERFDKCFQKILKMHPTPSETPADETATAPQPAEKIKIATLGKFEIFRPGEPPVAWRSRKTMELAAFLVHSKGKTVSKERIVEAIWPNLDWDSASNQLYKNIHYIRSALKQHGLAPELIQIQGRYSLVTAPHVEIDSASFQNELSGLPPAGPVDDFKAVNNLYSGNYMGDFDWIWAYIERERLQSLHNSLVVEIARKYKETQHFAPAECVLLEALDQSPQAEILHAELFGIYQAEHRDSDAHALLARYKDGLPPGGNVGLPECIAKATQYLKD